MAAKTAAVAEKAQERKDPGIAALISVVCMLFLAAPAAGYFYLGKVKKGIIYLIASWLVLGLVVGFIFLGGTIIAVISTMLAVVCPLFAVGAFLPVCGIVLLIIPLLFDLVIVYDVYLEAKGQKPLLPFSEE